ncbi:MAG: hypothetical protein K5662_06435 [Lachnospiraceae bacterium]|nr:hypothetical protein [Lachnospiraceae bacterium]
MKLRYYLRGIGIGIIVSTAICICASVRDNKMSDEEVMARARELGMTEEAVYLSDAAGGSEADETAYSEAFSESEDETVSEEVMTETESDEEAVTEETPEVESDAGVIESSEAEEIVEEESQPAEEPVSEVKPDGDSEGNVAGGVSGEEYVVLVIEKGNGSDTVARKLYDLGLISDAAAYDKFLCRNGYDRRIASGTHEIPKGASDEMIAEIICSRR